MSSCSSKSELSGAKDEEENANVQRLVFWFSPVIQSVLLVARKGVHESRRVQSKPERIIYAP